MKPRYADIFIQHEIWIKIFVSFSGAETKHLAARTPSGFLIINFKQRGNIQCDITFNEGKWTSKWHFMQKTIFSLSCLSIGNMTGIHTGNQFVYVCTQRIEWYANHGRSCTACWDINGLCVNWFEVIKTL